jgi:hypothetical protein
MNSAIEILQCKIEWLTKDIKRETESIENYTRLKQQAYEKRTQHKRELEELRQALSKLV